jgi:hypothetical protein
MYEYRQLTPAQRAEVVQQRLAKGYPPHSPPHPIQDQSYYLLTAACYEHKCHMKIAVIFTKYTIPEMQRSPLPTLGCLHRRPVFNSSNPF